MKNKYIVLTLFVIWIIICLILFNLCKKEFKQEQIKPVITPIELIEVNNKARVSCYTDIGTMAGGKQTYKGAVAVSDRLIPMGTKIYLEEFGEMTVEDKTAKWVHTKFDLPTIDVWMTEKDCKEFGLKKLNYVIVK